MYGDRDNTLGGYGRVEIKMNGLWHTVCDDGFDANSAKVLCSHLGHVGGEVTFSVIRNFNTDLYKNGLLSLMLLRNIKFTK